MRTLAQPKENSDSAIILILCLIPFLQLGIGMYFSVQMFLSIYILYEIKPNNLKPALLFLCYELVLVCVSNIVYPEYDIILSREFRTAIIASITLSFATTSVQKLVSDNFKFDYILYLMGVLLAISLIQILLLKVGISPYLPADWFAISGDRALGSNWYTFALEHELEYEGRMSAFYSEPSFLGSIAILLHIIMLVNGTAKQRVISTVLALLMSMICQSGLGMIGNAFITVLAYHRLRIATVYIIPIAIFFTAVISGFLPPRIASILSGTDESTVGRMFEPLFVILDVWQYHPLGVPFTGIGDFFVKNNLVADMSEPPTHNGFYNTLYSYGIVGLLYFAYLFRARSWYCIIGVLLIMFQSGSAFTFNKLVMYGLLFQFTLPKLKK